MISKVITIIIMQTGMANVGRDTPDRRKRIQRVDGQGLRRLQATSIRGVFSTVVTYEVDNDGPFHILGICSARKMSVYSARAIDTPGV